MMLSRYQKGYNHMAYAVTQRITSFNDIIYGYCNNFCQKAMLWYNVAFFRVCNTFTGYEKEYRISNEVEVFNEIVALQNVYLSIHIWKVIPYCHMEKPMRVAKKTGFLFRTSQADGPIDGKTGDQRFQKLAGFFKEI